jgi:predicted secreted protein
MFTKSISKGSFVSSSLLAVVASAMFAITGCAAQAAPAPANDGDVSHQETQKEVTQPDTQKEVAQPDGWVVAPVMIDEKSKDATVSVSAGQPIVLTLASNATTGFEWSITSNGLPIDAPAVHYEAAGQEPGSGGSTAFTWANTKTLSPGRYPLTLGYARSWETVAPAETFSFVVEIVR